jgi:hypothetical protein
MQCSKERPIDHLVGTGEQHWWDYKAKPNCGFDIER